MSSSRAALAVLLSVGVSVAAGPDSVKIYCDADSDCFYVPELLAGKTAAGLVVLHCNGALPIDLDTMTNVADSLGWVMASCHATRNHRDLMLNDQDIVRTTRKLLSGFPVDSTRIFVFGYSGQGVQAMASLFLHPELYRGLAATCAHRASMPLAVWETLADKYVFLATRAEDWNRADNEQMHVELNEHGVKTGLSTTEGVHQPGPATELLKACRWLDGQTRP
jgi:poly(3-hydroxybutyrate) depolymerase